MTAADAARRAVAARLSRPYSDVDAKATEIVDTLTAAGWRPPPETQPGRYRREHANPADPDHAAAALARMRALLDDLRRRRHESEHQ